MKKLERKVTGAKIQSSRESLKMCREELAELCDTTVGNIQVMEEGIFVPGPHLAVKLALYLGVNVTDIRPKGYTPELMCVAIEEVRFQ
ncbi:helix-turn-helix domain-containing protein [Brevibacillus reuszeri]|uniref:helix-turn-helix domain-containing protein n=1 Tax=Brevibacillus reuszeri TaxID=54915 RepID=UPI003D1F74E5